MLGRGAGFVLDRFPRFRLPPARLHHAAAAGKRTLANTPTGSIRYTPNERLKPCCGKSCEHAVSALPPPIFDAAFGTLLHFARASSVAHGRVASAEGREVLLPALDGFTECASERRDKRAPFQRQPQNSKADHAGTGSPP